MGLELAGAVIGLTLCGLWVDYKFDTGHIGLITGASIGVVGGMYNFIRQALALMDENAARKKDDHPDSGDRRTDEP